MHEHAEWLAPGVRNKLTLNSNTPLERLTVLRLERRAFMWGGQRGGAGCSAGVTACGQQDSDRSAAPHQSWTIGTFEAEALNRGARWQGCLNLPATVRRWESIAGGAGSRSVHEHGMAP
jgi:hypothetical protein